MAAHHSLGPWIFEHNGAGDQKTNCIDVKQQLDDEFRGSVCYIQSCDHIGGITMEESEANARLIAAAPDLLEALRGLDEAYCRAGTDLTRDERTEDRNRLIAARAAIAKATGKSQ